MPFNVIEVAVSGSRPPRPREGVARIFGTEAVLSGFATALLPGDGLAAAIAVSLWNGLGGEVPAQRLADTRS